MENNYFFKPLKALLMLMLINTEGTVNLNKICWCFGSLILKCKETRVSSEETTEKHTNQQQQGKNKEKKPPDEQKLLDYIQYGAEQCPHEIRYRAAKDIKLWSYMIT